MNEFQIRQHGDIFLLMFDVAFLPRHLAQNLG